MRSYFEYRNSINDKCVRTADLDIIVCNFFNITIDSRKYAVPPYNEDISWFDLIEDLIWLPDFDNMGDRITMQDLILALEKNQSCFSIQEVEPYISLLNLFEEMNLYLYVVFLETSFFDEEVFKPYQTIDPDKIYQKEEIMFWTKVVPDYECLKRVYDFRSLFVR